MDDRGRDQSHGGSAEDDGLRTGARGDPGGTPLAFTSSVNAIELDSKQSLQHGRTAQITLGAITPWLFP